MAKNHYCLGCEHYRRIASSGCDLGAFCCHYLLDTGHVRGCPFGEGYTRRAEKEETET